VDNAAAKSLITSKTFWFNAIVLLITVTDVVPTKYSAQAAVIGNVILRLMTSQACTLFPTTTTTANKPKQ
jgi:hypothetical protein